MVDVTRLYEGHEDVLAALRKKVLELLQRGPGQFRAQDVKDVTTAYVMAIDKLNSFHVQALAFADREWITKEEAMRMITGGD